MAMHLEPSPHNSLGADSIAIPVVMLKAMLEALGGSFSLDGSSILHYQNKKPDDPVVKWIEYRDPYRVVLALEEPT